MKKFPTQVEFTSTVSKVQAELDLNPDAQVDLRALSVDGVTSEWTPATLAQRARDIAVFSAVISSNATVSTGQKNVRVEHVAEVLHYVAGLPTSEERLEGGKDSYHPAYAHSGHVEATREIPKAQKETPEEFTRRCQNAAALCGNLKRPTEYAVAAADIDQARTVAIFSPSARRINKKGERVANRTASFSQRQEQCLDIVQADLRNSTAAVSEGIPTNRVCPMAVDDDGRLSANFWMRTNADSVGERIRELETAEYQVQAVLGMVTREKAALLQDHMAPYSLGDPKEKHEYSATTGRETREGFSGTLK